ncbi:MAG: HAD hydrolase family protein [Halobacteriota archaeon]
MQPAIFFDLEGPLSPQDNAYEVMKLIGKEGAAIFEVISRYDDIISLDGKEGYEPGDALALIIPFLLLHGITEEDIRAVSAGAKIVEGADYLFERLRAENWDTYIISTSYEYHAYNIGHKLGVEPGNIICTELDLERKKRDIRDKDAFFSLIREVEEELIELYSHIDEPCLIAKHLDEFFFQQLPYLGFDVLGTRVMGGERKAEAVRAIAKIKGVSLSEVIVVGDSITDYKMLEEVARHGGVSVVFNGNEYAVPYANVGLASVDIRFLWILCTAFVRAGKGAVMAVVRDWEDNRADFETNPAHIPDNSITEDLRDLIMNRQMALPYFHDVERADGEEREEIIRAHKQVRMQVRADAGKLG